jgi:hypothetical protein
MCLLYFKYFFNTIPEIRKTAPAMRTIYIKPVFPVPANPPVIVAIGVGVVVGPGSGVLVGPGVLVRVDVGVGVLVKVVVGVGVELGVVPQFPIV